MALRGDLEAVEFLLQNGAHVDKVGNDNVTPLFGCLKMPKDLIYIAETLLKHGANINYPCGESEQTVLHHAVYRGKPKIVEFLLKHGADVNALDCDEMTPLYWATFYNKVKIVKTFLINGANPNIQDIDKKITPIFSARNKETLKIFFDYAIDLDLSKRNFEGNTAFENSMQGKNMIFAKIIVYFQSF